MMTERDASETTDLIVVGAGAAGFAAAVTAAAAGASVILLEKSDRPGGTTAKSGGSTWIPNNDRMAALGQIDDRAAALRYMARLAFPHRYYAEAASLGLDEADFHLLETLTTAARRPSTRSCVRVRCTSPIAPTPTARR